MLQHPAYASKYAPFPGLALALGQCLGHPALGVFLVSSLAVAASYWASRSVLSHLWALFAAGLIWIQIAPYSVYSGTYMGANVGVLGACLLLGAGFRICRFPSFRIRDAILLALGVWILAASRPYEGMVLCLAMALPLSVCFWILPVRLKRIGFLRTFLPGSLTLGAGAAFLLLYNQSVTGHALTLPYSVYEADHSRTPLFVWGKPTDTKLVPAPNLERFEKEFTAATYQAEKSKSFAQRFEERLIKTLKSFSPFWPLGVLLLLFSIGSSRPWVWFSWFVFFFFMAASSCTVWFFGHYLGSVLPFLTLLWAAGGQCLCRFTLLGVPLGRHLFRLVLVFLVIMPILLFFIAPGSSERAGSFATSRQRLQKELMANPGSDLVLVTYLDHPDVAEEWVYNSADIENAEIVWAHDLGKIENEKLIRHFSNRRIWRLEINRDQSDLKEIFPSPSK